MSKTFVSGYEVRNFLHEALDLELSFDLIRSEEKNLGMKFSEIIISPFVTNSSIGLCLANNINLHLSLFPFEYSNIHFLDEGATEILYKNDIFIGSFGIDWITRSKVAHILVNSVFGKQEADIWCDSKLKNVLHLHLTSKINLESLFVRINSTYTYLPPKVETQSLSVQHVLLWFEGQHPDILTEPIPDVIISSEINSQLINLCFKYNIPLIYINSVIIYDEIIRETHHFISRRTKINIIYQKSFQGKFI